MSLSLPLKGCLQSSVQRFSIGDCFGIQRTFRPNKSTVNKQKEQIMNHSSLENVKPEPQPNSEQKADNQHVSQSIANAHVGRSAINSSGHYVMLTGIRERNFLAYNLGAFEMSNEDVSDEDILQLKYKELTPTIQKLKSDTWSCNCEWFFVFQAEGIYLMSVSEDTFFLCKKHSMKFIDHFINTPLKLKK